MAKNLSFLGVDLGTFGIKVVELANEKKKPKLITYGFSENKLDNLQTDFSQATVKVASILQDVCLQAKTTSRQVIASLPSFDVYSSVITLPEMDKKELKQAIAIKAQGLIPLPVEQTIIDWKIIAKVTEPPLPAQQGLPIGEEGITRRILTRQQPYLKILLTGTAKKLVETYLAIFKAANLNLLSLETEAFALVRSLIGNDKSTILVADLGATTSTLMVVQGGLPVMHRSIQHGGVIVTKYLAQKTNISWLQAEQFKQDFGLLLGQSQFSPALQASFSPIINEIKYTFNLFLQQNPGQKIEKVILTGGSALLPNLPQFLSNILNTKVYLGDPWARVIYPEELKPILDTIGTKMSIAIGLAMREII